MAIGKVSGSMLVSNLDRQGTDLQFTTNSQPLVYMDFAQFRMGVNTSSLSETLTINGNLSTSNIVINGSTISTKSGNLTIGSPVELGSIGDVHITGGSANYLVTTDGNGNLSFIDANSQPGIATIEANIGAYQLWANANLATQTTNYDTLYANVGAYETYANANIGNIYTHLNTLDANVGAYEIYANANIGTIYTHLNTLDANVGAYESWANANLATQTTNFDTLNANVGAYQLWANANLATQTTNFDTLYANVGAYEIYANANAATQAGYIDTINSNVAAANTAIATLQTQVYSNANVASYLTVFNGNINAGNIGLSGNLYTDYISANIGNVVSFTGTGAVSIPIGDTAQRPSGVAGYVRYNSDNNQIEYFNGTVWVPVTNTVTDQQITGDGINDTYTLDQSATNVGVLVSINGTLQAPGTAYIVSDNQITFAEVPLSTDIIDVRYLGGTISINSTLSDDLVVSGNLTLSGNISGTVNGYSIGYKDIPQIGTNNANIILTANDGGKHYLSTTNTANVIYIPTNANVPLSTGTVITVVLQGAGNIQVVANAGVTLYMAGNATTGTNTRIISAYGVASILKTGTNTWFINGTGVS